MFKKKRSKRRRKYVCRSALGEGGRRRRRRRRRRKRRRRRRRERESSVTSPVIASVNVMRTWTDAWGLSSVPIVSSNNKPQSPGRIKGILRRGSAVAGCCPKRVSHRPRICGLEICGWGRVDVTATNQQQLQQSGLDYLPAHINVDGYCLLEDGLQVTLHKCSSVVCSHDQRTTSSSCQLPEFGELKSRPEKKKVRAMEQHKFYKKKNKKRKR
jgi:hypothetical protein